MLATITAAGRARMAQIAAEHSQDWQGLGVAILHRLVIDTLLGAKDLPKPRYVHLVEEVVDGLDGTGLDSVDGGKGLEGAKADEFPLAALVMPATVDHIRQSASTANGCRPRAPISTRSCSAGWSLTRWSSNSQS